MCTTVITHGSKGELALRGTFLFGTHGPKALSGDYKGKDNILILWLYDGSYFHGQFYKFGTCHLLSRFCVVCGMKEFD